MVHIFFFWWVGKHSWGLSNFYIPAGNWQKYDRKVIGSQLPHVPSWIIAKPFSSTEGRVYAPWNHANGEGVCSSHCHCSRCWDEWQSISLEMKLHTVNIMLVILPWLRNCGSQVSLAVWDYRSPPFLEACMAPSGSMKASSQKRGFQGRSSSGPPGPVSEVHGVISIRDLPSTSCGGNPRITAVGSLLNNPDQQQKR